ncbi:DUF3159 domain-containing protein [Pseudarthrobacter sp. P1]|uniref:DUF3159 domain-containing protein n=1 Tax=Pseudarthrobacter sp. P1 TaxID=3418418 RepID=UPI003CFA33D1
MTTPPNTPQPAPEPARPETSETPSLESLAHEIAAKSSLARTASGHIDLLNSAGGWRGIAESILPGLVFLIVFTLTRPSQNAAAEAVAPNQGLVYALIAAFFVSAVFMLVRLVQKSPATQAFAGVAGVALSAVLALTTGKAENFYLWGFITNAGYIVGMVASILLRWPVLGLLFGYARNEGLRWRANAERRRAYAAATWIIVGVMTLRLVVQFPLYLAGQVDALGATRLLMGVPLYALGLWVAWLISRPVKEPEAEPAEGP